MRKIKNFFFLNAFKESITADNLSLQQQFRLFKITTAFTLLIFLTSVFQITFASTFRIGLLIGVSILFFLVFINYFWLAVHKKPKLAFYSLVVLIYLILHFLTYGLGGIRSSGIFFLAAIIFVAYMLLGKAGGKFMALISIIHVVYFYFATVYGTWVDYSLIGTEPGLIDLDFLITGILSVIVLTVQVDYIEKNKNAIIDDFQVKKNELLEMNTELLSSQIELYKKNKELEQFVYVASHDLQEPIRTTNSFVSLLQNQYKGKLDDKADQYLHFIGQSSERMKVLINDLLEYSRIGSTKELERIDCNVILKEVLADLDTVINESKAVIISIKLPIVDGYSTELKRLFQNLIINAIKFRNKDLPPRITISAEKEFRFWKFTISDNGIGIEEKYQDRIFEIFQRLHTRSEYEGSGIGLSHCKKIIELHHGNIWVQSSFGEGASFHFTLPDNKLKFDLIG